MSYTSYDYIAKRLEINRETVSYNNLKYFKKETIYYRKSVEYYVFNVPGLLNELRALKNNYKKFPAFRESAIYRMDHIANILDKLHKPIVRTWKTKEKTRELYLS